MPISSLTDIHNIWDQNCTCQCFKKFHCFVQGLASPSAPKEPASLEPALPPLCLWCRVEEGNVVWGGCWCQGYSRGERGVWRSNAAWCRLLKNKFSWFAHSLQDLYLLLQNPGLSFEVIRNKRGTLLVLHYPAEWQVWYAGETGATSVHSQPVAQSQSSASSHKVTIPLESSRQGAPLFWPQWSRIYFPTFFYFVIICFYVMHFVLHCLH